MRHELTTPNTRSLISL